MKEVKRDVNEKDFFELAERFYSVGKLPEAIECYKNSITLNPIYYPSFARLGNLLREIGCTEQSVQYSKHALKIAPNNPKIIANYANSLREHRQIREAILMFQKALRLEPDNLEFKYNLGLCYLAAGRLLEGWRELECRWQYSAYSSVRREFPFPMWSGQPLKGQKILIWMEMGVGDMIAFCSIFNDPIFFECECCVEIDVRLVSLMQRSFPHVEWVAATHGPNSDLVQRDFAYQIPILSLMKTLRPNKKSFPRQPFLVPDPDKTKEWKDRIQQCGSGKKIGLSWRSRFGRADNAGNPNRRNFTELADWDLLFNMPDTKWFSLQYDQAAEEIHQQGYDNHIHVFQDWDAFWDFESMVAIHSQLDAVIGPFGTTTVVANALGVPTYRFYNRVVWMMLGCEHFPWAPPMPVFDRCEASSWEPVMREIKNALEYQFNGQA